MSKTLELARHLETLHINDMYKTDFYWTWDKTDDEIDAIFTVADALRDLRERNKSTRIFDSGLGISLFRDNSTRTRFSFASACNLLGLEVNDLDEKKREKWLEIAENLAPYPKGTIREIQENPTLWKEVDVKLEDLLPEEMLDKEIYYDEGIGGKWSFHFPGNVMQIYPGNAIGLGSAPEELEVARNTVQIHALVENALGELEYRKALEEAEFADKDNANNLLFNSNGELENGEAYSNGMESGGVKNPHFYKAGAFNASNLSCLFFTAAVRVGYAPEIIWKEMRDMILNRGIPNGFLKENPHGIEQLNTIPDAIQEMMLQSCEGMIRIFPVWPRAEHPNAFFRNFRAWGGLEVSAALKDGEVERVSILSHKGHPCRVENPWPGKSVKVSYEYGRPDEVHFGEYLNIELYKEEHAELFRI